MLILGSFYFPKVIAPLLMKPSGIYMEKIQQMFQRLKLTRRSQSFSSSHSNSDLGDSFNTESTRICAISDTSNYFTTQSCVSLTDYYGFGEDLVSEKQAPAVSDPSLGEICGADDKVPVQPEFCYEAESPDEAALVHAAHAYHFTLVSRSSEKVAVRLPEGAILTFDLLYTLGFDSNRKRMSVVVRHPLTNQIIVYTKGADAVIMDLLEDPARGNVN